MKLISVMVKICENNLIVNCSFLEHNLINSVIYNSRAIEMYTKRIKWLLQGSRKVSRPT